MLSKLQLPLALAFCQDNIAKILEEAYPSIINSLNNNTVCRTAPAASGLFFTKGKDCDYNNLFTCPSLLLT